MQFRTCIAVGIGAGYLLGRTKKLKLALLLGGVAAGKQLGTSPGELLSRGAAMARSSPQVKDLTDQVAGRLVDAGKTAALAAVSSRVEGLSDRLADRSAALRGDDQRADNDETDEDGRDDYDDDESQRDDYDEADEDDDEGERDDYDDEDRDEDDDGGERDDYDDEDRDESPDRDRHSGRRTRSAGRSRRRQPASSGSR